MPCENPARNVCKRFPGIRISNGHLRRQTKEAKVEVYLCEKKKTLEFLSHVV